MGMILLRSLLLKNTETNHVGIKSLQSALNICGIFLNNKEYSTSKLAPGIWFNQIMLFSVLVAYFALFGCL